MKAALCTRLGAPENLEIVDLPEPATGPGQVLVAIKAAALNFSDSLLIAGKYQIKPQLPFSPGGEFSGIAVGVGTGVTDIQPGDRVAGFCSYGAACERISVDARRLVKLPQQLDFDRAAGIAVTYGTSLYALKNRCRLARGETLAVLGASGGAGLSAVELGNLMGAHVIACASSDEKLGFARTHGAQSSVNYDKENLKDTLIRLTDSRGVDVIYDPVGAAYAEPALRSIAWNGRFAVVGFAGGEIPKLPANIVLLKNCDVVGVNFGDWVNRDLDGYRANMTTLMSWCAAGKISGHVHAAYPLEEIAKAIGLIADRKVTGKLILRP